MFGRRKVALLLFVSISTALPSVPSMLLYKDSTGRYNHEWMMQSRERDLETEYSKKESQLFADLLQLAIEDEGYTIPLQFRRLMGQGCIGTVKWYERNN